MSEATRSTFTGVHSGAHGLSRAPVLLNLIKLKRFQAVDAIVMGRRSFIRAYVRMSIFLAKTKWGQTKYNPSIQKWKAPLQVRAR